MKYVDNNLDIPMKSETKLDDIFRQSQFLIESFLKSNKLDRTATSGAILLYIRQDIPSKYLKKITVNEFFFFFSVKDFL